ncbi:RHS repeat-associated core domain-containing protein [Pseudomonas sp. S37]|uniref:RHS repeat-associated core domain-containing protein n=1 Tax=Pseudomonas sp. S37 TaxID=2767449 RepID=UPI001F3D00E4|nr:RHS repeat-associated core domain-containing protein [Pseudomonas sp. S37]MBK4997332.1 RHS repeat-associated core domain-containing protein [Pseudomonas sp. S37]
MNTTRFFMQQDRFHTALCGTSAVVCVRAQSGVLAETRLEQASISTALLATDDGESVVGVKSQAQVKSVIYNVYGFHNPDDIPAQRPAFNGHLLVNVLYLLGNGYRGYNPVLMRFHSPDSLSPFGVGGLNSYGYCEGDAINFSDPSGHGPIRRSGSLPGLSSESMMKRIVPEIVKNPSPRPRPRRVSDAGYRTPSYLDQTVQDVLNELPGWGTPDAPTQSSMQRNQASLIAEPINTQLVASAPRVVVRGKSRGLGNLDQERATLLLIRNYESDNTVGKLTLEQVHDSRRAAIFARMQGASMSNAIRQIVPGVSAKDIKVLVRPIINMLRVRQSN